MVKLQFPNGTIIENLKNKGIKAKTVLRYL